MTPDLKVLIVEDDPDIVLGCEQALQLEGIATESAPSAELARLRLGRDYPGVVVSDIRLPKMDGMAFLQELMGMDPELPVVLITGHGDVSMAVQAMKDGAHDFIQKPFAPEQLVGAVRRALDKRRLVLEVRQLRSQLAQRDAIERLVMGRAPNMQRLREVLAGLAASTVDVLIHGETGTGKELAARCLHDASPRSKGHFVAINCGGLPDTLFDSEMFGNEAGPSPGRASAASARLSTPVAAHCFSMKSKACPWPCRSSCCVCCKSACWSAWAPTRSSPSTAVWWLRPKWICWSCAARANSAKTCTTA